MTINRIMMPIDVGEQPRTVGSVVASLARRLDAEVLLFHAMTPDLEKYGEPFLFANRSRLEAHAEAISTDVFEEIATSEPFAGLRLATKFVKAKHAALAVVEWAQRMECDLIVVPNLVHVRERVRKVFLGSVTERILRESYTRVLICPTANGENDAEGDFRRIVAPTDLSEAANSAFSSAAEIARAFGAHLDLLHVIEQRKPLPLPFQICHVHSAHDMNPEFREGVTVHLESMAAEQFPDVDCSIHFRLGKASVAIQQFVEHNSADLIVMATEGQDSIGDLILGSTTERVVKATSTPILIEPLHRTSILAESS